MRQLCKNDGVPRHLSRAIIAVPDVNSRFRVCIADNKLYVEKVYDSVKKGQPSA